MFNAKILGTNYNELQCMKYHQFDDLVKMKNISMFGIPKYKHTQSMYLYQFLQVSNMIINAFAHEKFDFLSNIKPINRSQ